MPMPRRGVLVAAIAAGLLVLGGIVYLIWPSDPYADLRDSDPRGAAACQTLADWIDGKIEGDSSNARFAVAEDAYNSTTPAIKATAANASEGTALSSIPLYVAKIETLYTACKGAGVDMPDPAGKLTPE